MDTEDARVAELRKEIAEVADENTIVEMLRTLSELKGEGVIRARYNLQSPYGSGVFRCAADHT